MPPQKQSDALRVIVVGAGLSGLMAARGLHAAGHDVTVFDKGRGVGGRLATRRIGDAVVDHGAQFFTVRTDRFAAHVDEWVRLGVVHEWCRGFAVHDGHPRYVGTSGMTGIAKHLALGLDVRTGTLAFTLADVDGGLVVKTDDGIPHEADRVIVTTPTPQAFGFLMNVGLELPEGLRSGEYVRTLGLLAVLDSDDHAVPPPGGVQDPDGVFQFVGDNKAKGISPVPALTFHFSPGFSAGHYDDDPESLHSLMRESVQPWLGRARIVESQVKKWRFATPLAVHPDPCWVSPDGRVVMAGDAFAGPRVEAAALSGLAAADALSSRG